jgi:hypothetical protein
VKRETATDHRSRGELEEARQKAVGVLAGWPWSKETITHAVPKHASGATARQVNQNTDEGSRLLRHPDAVPPALDIGLQGSRRARRGGPPYRGYW